jgi:hypothetical protein
MRSLGKRIKSRYAAFVRHRKKREYGISASPWVPEDIYGFRKPIEGRLGEKYRKAIGVQPLKGHEYHIDPYDVAPIARGLLDELLRKGLHKKQLNPERAALVFAEFVSHIKGIQDPRIKMLPGGASSHYLWELEGRIKEPYSSSSLFTNEADCNLKATLFAALCRSVGIPALFHRTPSGKSDYGRPELSHEFAEGRALEAHGHVDIALPEEEVRFSFSQDKSMNISTSRDGALGKWEFSTDGSYVKYRLFDPKYVFSCFNRFLRT